MCHRVKKKKKVNVKYVVNISVVYSSDRRESKKKLRYGQQKMKGHLETFHLCL